MTVGVLGRENEVRISRSAEIGQDCALGSGTHVSEGAVVRLACACCAAFFLFFWEAGDCFGGILPARNPLAKFVQQELPYPQGRCLVGAAVQLSCTSCAASHIPSKLADSDARSCGPSPFDTLSDTLARRCTKAQPSGQVLSELRVHACAMRPAVQPVSHHGRQPFWKCPKACHASTFRA